ncbi:hypothetical protein [Streptomyces sp. NBC_01789]|uniref:hypothetical protein n=1 Tax=Streptomyces sp. NBC_01789 TaxID=2975941 RepID=UPI002256BEA8|nr:hypothetical protein [Streptomyces sp. NBC_01789]MCX4451607.1 hypothetical protein [Streptomyces sp. NBC_01789]
MNINHPRSTAQRMLGVLLVVTAGVVAARSQAWESALGTAAAVYTVLSTMGRDRRN